MTSSVQSRQNTKSFTNYQNGGHGFKISLAEYACITGSSIIKINGQHLHAELRKSHENVVQFVEPPTQIYRTQNMLFCAQKPTAFRKLICLLYIFVLITSSWQSNLVQI